jgi:hypothetical protein
MLIGSENVSKLSNASQGHSMESLPWLTFLRFFEVRAGASEPGADEDLSLDGDLLFATIDVEASVPWSASLAIVILGEAAPLDLRAASGINRSGVGGFQS